MMKSRKVFPIVAVVCFVCFGAVGTLSAEDPYINISLPVAELDFGSIPNPGDHVFSPTFSMHIDANIAHHIEISMSQLTHTSGISTIAPNGFQVLTPISSSQGTPFGGEDVNVQVQFSVNTSGGDRAGQYRGMLVITAIPGP
jgi:hypothetical protein